MIKFLCFEEEETTEVIQKTASQGFADAQLKRRPLSITILNSVRSSVPTLVLNADRAG